MARYTRTNIIEVARARGWSVAWVARKMGRDRTLFYMVTNGQRAITEDFVRRACDLFGLPESALFFDPKPSLLGDTDPSREQETACVAD
jgi:cyanate lyase